MKKLLILASFLFLFSTLHAQEHALEFDGSRMIM